MARIEEYSWMSDETEWNARLELAENETVESQIGDQRIEEYPFRLVLNGYEFTGHVHGALLADQDARIAWIDSFCTQCPNTPKLQ